MHVFPGIALDLTNTEAVDPIIADKDPLPPMPRLLLTTADHKLQIWDLKTEGICLTSRLPCLIILGPILLMQMQLLLASWGGTAQLLCALGQTCLLLYFKNSLLHEYQTAVDLFSPRLWDIFCMRVVCVGDGPFELESMKSVGLARGS